MAQDLLEIKKNCSTPFHFTVYSQAAISQTKPGSSVAARREELRAVLSFRALTTQQEEAAVAETPAGVAPPVVQ